MGDYGGARESYTKLVVDMEVVFERMFEQIIFWADVIGNISSIFSRIVHMQIKIVKYSMYH